MPLTVDTIAGIVRRWAAGQPLVRRAYLFGSRARGDNRPDSDIDLAVVCRMDRKILRQCDGDWTSARICFWHDYHQPWLDQLRRLFPVPVDLQILDRDTRRIVHPAVKREGVRVA